MLGTGKSPSCFAAMPKLLFTPLNARIMAARSVEVRRANAEAEKLARTTVSLLLCSRRYLSEWGV
jgi:hypothetical protein